MTETANVPNLRFEGFTEPWEERKLGEMLQTLPFKPFLKEPEPGGKYEIIQQGNNPVIGYANGIPCCDYKDTVIFGDHTLSLYKPERPFFVATDGVRIVKGKQNINGFFLLALLERYKPQNEGYKRYYGILSDTESLIINDAVEQQQIGVFFRRLDTLINLHQRNHERLKHLKQAMLQKMFPKPGEPVPELRFKGFTEPWEKRKLGEMLQTLPFKPFLKEPEPGGKYEIIQQGNNPVIGYANGIPCCDYKDTVIFGDHTLSLYKPERPFFVATDGVRIVKGKQNINGFFLLALLERYKPQNEGYKRYYGILSDTESLIINDAVEQQQIGVFFRRLDTLINLHQRNHERLKHLKQAMLQKMFV